MNLSQIATAVGQRTGLVGPNDVIACKNFLTIRHDQLWRSFLWKDSLAAFVITCDPSVAYVPNAFFMPTKGQLILPSVFQHVIAVRNDKGKMDVQRPMVYFRVAQDTFAQSGQPYEFFSMGACVWEFDTPQVIGYIATNNADAGQNVTTDVLDADEATVDRIVTSLNPAVGGYPKNFANIATTDRVEAITNPILQGAVMLNVANTTIVTQSAGVQIAPKRQQIKLMPNISGAFTLRVLGKRITPSFSADTDAPGVNGLDAILMALAYYDMCHRDERGGTPEVQGALSEAVGPNFISKGVPGGFLGKLIEEEVQQAAYNSRIMPEEGFGGDEYFQGSWNTKGSPY